MTKITTDFTGGENATVRANRRKEIHDYYYGSGSAVAQGTFLGVRNNINDIYDPDTNNAEAFGSWLTKWNALNDPSKLVHDTLFGPAGLAVIDDAFGADGVTPVALQGAISLAVDDFEGLELGAELLGDPSFDTGTGWTAPTGWTITGGQAVKTAGVSNSLVRAVSVTAGRAYMVELDAASVTAGVFQMLFTGGSSVFGPALTAGGRIRAVVLPVSGNTTFALNANAAAEGVFNSVSVREVLNFPAFQNLAAARGLRGQAPKEVRNLARPSQVNVAGTALIIDNQTATFTGASAVVNDDSETQVVSPFYQRMPAAYVPFFGPNPASVTQRRVRMRIRTFGDTIASITNINGGTVTNTVGLPVTSAEGWKWIEFELGGTSSLSPRVNGTASDWAVATVQIDAGPIATSYQRTSNVLAPDITEAGVTSYPVWAGDGTDDAADCRVYSGQTFGIFIPGRYGSWWQGGFTAAADGTITVGPTSIFFNGVALAGVPTGILRACGTVPWSSRLLVAGLNPFVITKSVMSTEELRLLVRRYAAIGARGLLVEGPELVTNGTFDTDLTGWTVGSDAAQVVPTWTAGGKVTLTRGAGGANGFGQAIGQAAAAIYIVRASIESGTVSVRMGNTTEVSWVAGSNARVMIAASATTTPQDSFGLWPQNSSSSAVLDDLSVKALTPEPL
jgi:hypothetical protein